MEKVYKKCIISVLLYYNYFVCIYLCSNKARFLLDRLEIGQQLIINRPALKTVRFNRSLILFFIVYHYILNKYIHICIVYHLLYIHGLDVNRCRPWYIAIYIYIYCISLKKKMYICNVIVSVIVNVKKCICILL